MSVTNVFPHPAPKNFKLTKSQKEEIKEILFDKLPMSNKYHLKQWLENDRLPIKIKDDDGSDMFGNIEDIEIKLIFSYGGFV